MLGRRLEQLRASKSLSQAEVARALNLTQQAIDNYEKGTREPKGAILVRIARYYGVSSDYLLGLTDNPKHMPENEEDVARTTSDPSGDELVVVFRGKRQKLDPAYQKLLIKMLEDDTNEEDAKSQP